MNGTAAIQAKHIPTATLQRAANLNYEKLFQSAISNLIYINFFIFFQIGVLLDGSIIFTIFP